VNRRDEEYRDGDHAGSAGEEKKADAPAASPLLPGGADFKRVREMLEGLGHEVKEVEPGFLTIKASVAGGQFSPTFALSPDRSVLWVNVYLVSAKSIPAGVLEKMLMANNTHNPSVFKIVHGYVMMSGMMTNRYMTPQKLKA